jgi:hypothetical protein
MLKGVKFSLRGTYQVSIGRFKFPIFNIRYVAPQYAVLSLILHLIRSMGVSL